MRLGEILHAVDPEKIAHFLPGGQVPEWLEQARGELGPKGSQSDGILALARGPLGLYPVLIEGAWGAQSVRRLRVAPADTWAGLSLDPTARQAPLAQLIALCLLEWAHQTGRADDTGRA